MYIYSREKFAYDFFFSFAKNKICSDDDNEYVCTSEKCNWKKKEKNNN